MCSPAIPGKSIITTRTSKPNPETPTMDAPRQSEAAARRRHAGRGRDGDGGCRRLKFSYVINYIIGRALVGAGLQQSICTDGSNIYNCIAILYTAGTYGFQYLIGLRALIWNLKEPFSSWFFGSPAYVALPCNWFRRVFGFRLWGLGGLISGFSVQDFGLSPIYEACTLEPQDNRIPKKHLDIA